MNVPVIFTIFAGVIVTLKLLGYIALAWTPILWGIGIVFGFQSVMVIFAMVTLSLANRNLRRW